MNRGIKVMFPDKFCGDGVSDVNSIEKDSNPFARGLLVTFQMLYGRHNLASVEASFSISVSVYVLVTDLVELQFEDDGYGLGIELHCLISSSRVLIGGIYRYDC
jgi:hypothetical protein